MQPNSLAFIALCNEFCSSLEALTGSASTSRADFVASMLNYIPRLYISATDLRPGHDESEHHHHHHDCDCGHDHDHEEEEGDFMFDDELYSVTSDGDEHAIEDVLDEETYDAVRQAVEAVMGEEDVYLEVFEEDMKYSDTPVSASVSEGLADIFQSLYNFIETIREMPVEHIDGVLASAKEDFEHYWSRIACNLMRALNAARYFSSASDDEEL